MKVIGCLRFLVKLGYATALTLVVMLIIAIFGIAAIQEASSQEVSIEVDIVDSTARGIDNEKRARAIECARLYSTHPIGIRDLEVLSRVYTPEELVAHMTEQFYWSNALGLRVCSAEALEDEELLGVEFLCYYQQSRIPFPSMYDERCHEIRARRRPVSQSTLDKLLWPSGVPSDVND